MSLEEIKEWRENSTLQEAQESFISRVDYLISHCEELEQEVGNLISGIRSINKSKHHKIYIPCDDEPCYWQRQEWVEWILELADSADAIRKAYGLEE